MSWERLRSGGAVPEGFEMGDYVLGDSCCVLVAEDVTTESMLNNVIKKSEDEGEGEADHNGECDDAPTEVVNVADILRRFAVSVLVGLHTVHGVIVDG